MAWRVGLGAITIAGFGLRMHALGAVPLRWDEGWSLALAALAPAEILRLTALDVHPPLYYLLLKPWLVAGGAHELWARAFSALAGAAAAPLAANAALAWWRAARPASHGPGRAAGGGGAPATVRTSNPAPDRCGRLAGLCAAGYCALAPAFVYYAGVTRMYALTTPFLLLAVWGMARLVGADRPRALPTALAAALIGALGALYTFYYAAFALAGLLAAAWLLRPAAWRRIGGLALLIVLGYLPWLALAVPPMLGRVGAKTGGTLDTAALPATLADALFAAFFAYRAGWAAVGLAGLVLIAGLFAAGAGPCPSRRLPWLALPLLPLAGVLAGAAYGAQAHMFAPRYMIVATPFLALGLGWAVAALAHRRPVLGALAAAALILALAPTLARYSYAREAELDAAWDPAADWRELAPRSGPDDIVAFNILSLAGIYARYRGPEDPAWTYAQLWDPVHEPLADAVARLEAAAGGHPRLWLVLYKGEVAPDSAALKAWADATLFPAEGWWAGDTRYQAYVKAGSMQPLPAAAVDFGQGVRLVGAAFTPRARPGGPAAVELVWQAQTAPGANARVFVHAYDTAGRLVAQHDAFPAGDTRPPRSWQPGERIADRHGLVIPPEARGPLQLRVGLYDPETGERWAIRGSTGSGLEAAADSLALGTIELAEDEG